MSPGLESWKGPSHAKAIKSACACFWFIYGYISMFTSKSFIHLKFFLMKTGSIYTRFSLYSSQPLLPEPYRQSYLFSHRFELLSSKFSNFCVPLVPGLFMPSCFFFSPNIYFIFVRAVTGDTEKRGLPSTGSFPSWPQLPGQSQLKPGARSCSLPL